MAKKENETIDPSLAAGVDSQPLPEPKADQIISDLPPAEVKEVELDMSLDARMARAKAALDEAIDAQNQVNAIVAQRTKELDELIIEQSGSGDKNPMSEIQFYLTRQQRKREQKLEQRQRMLENGFDPLELIKQLDTRAPIDQKQGVRKVDPRAVKPAVPVKPAA